MRERKKQQGKIILRFLGLSFIWAIVMICQAGESFSHEIQEQGFHNPPVPCAPVYESQAVVYKPATTYLTVPDSQEKALEELRKRCDEAKNAQRLPKQSDLFHLRKRLITAMHELEQRLASHPDPDAAQQWKDDLELEKLRKFLEESLSNSNNVIRKSDIEKDVENNAEKNHAEKENGKRNNGKNGNGKNNGEEADPLQIVKDTYQEILDPHKGYHAEIFAPVKTLLRQYLTYQNAVKNEKFLEEYVQYCQGIPKFVESYMNDEHPEYAPALSRATLWLTDLGPCMDSAKRISNYLKIILGRPNIYVYVSSDFLSHAFERNVLEPLEVNECVIDMPMRGSGHVQGKTKMSFQGNNSQAQFLLRFYSQVFTNTSGVKGPAKVYSRNTSSNVSELSIFFTPDGVFANSARSQVNLRSQTSGLAVKSPPIIRPLVQPLICSVAQKQVQKNKPRYEAASRQLLEKRLNERFNKEVQENLANINKRYKDEFQRPLKESGFYPRTLTFRTGAQTLLVSAALADESQPCTGSTLSTVRKQVDFANKDISVQIHQSALNNLMNQLLSGERMDEAAFCNMVEKRFPKLAERVRQYIPQKENEDEPPLALTFAEQSPIKITFLDQTLTIVLQIDSFEEEEATYPGLDITIRFRVQVKDNESGVSQIVFEKLETTVFPPGFDPEGKARLNAREQIIRNVVLKRLEKRLESSYQLETLELGEQWKGKGKLTPSSASVENGWLSLSWIFR